MNKNEKLLSIIVPVYNVEEYLEECLDSLVTQDISYDEYEILCIDDGSTDKSGEILDLYAEKYTNIVVVHKENGGVSSARNCGIDIAKGEYIWFVDADDFIAKNCLQELKQLCPQKYDIINFGAYVFHEVFTLDEQVLYENKELKANETYWGCLWTHLFRSEVINTRKISFEKSLKYGEDELFYTDMQEISNNIIQTDFTLYYHRKISSSSMGLLSLGQKNEVYFQSVLLQTILLKKGIETGKYQKEFAKIFLKRRYKVCAHCLSRVNLIIAQLWFNKMQKAELFNYSAKLENYCQDKEDFRKMYLKMNLINQRKKVWKSCRRYFKKLLPDSLVGFIKQLF